MKKYAIIIGENNEELSRKVQEALFKVGFEWNAGSACTKSIALGVNVVGDRQLSTCIPFEKANIGFVGGTEWLPASYVLAHAADLDGAKLPQEIPPEGYRLVTDEEQKLYPCPEGGYMRGLMRYREDEWVHSTGPDGWNGTYHCYDSHVFAVPLNFTFAPEIKEVTMEELEAKYGCKVQVVRKG